MGRQELGNKSEADYGCENIDGGRSVFSGNVYCVPIGIELSEIREKNNIFCILNWG